MSVIVVVCLAAYEDPYITLDDDEFIVVNRLAIDMCPKGASVRVLFVNRLSDIVFYRAFAMFSFNYYSNVLRNSAQFREVVKSIPSTELLLAFVMGTHPRLCSACTHLTWMHADILRRILEPLRCRKTVIEHACFDIENVEISPLQSMNVYTGDTFTDRVKTVLS